MIIIDAIHNVSLSLQYTSIHFLLTSILHIQPFSLKIQFNLRRNVETGEKG